MTLWFNRLTLRFNRVLRRRLGVVVLLACVSASGLMPDLAAATTPAVTTTAVTTAAVPGAVPEVDYAYQCPPRPAPGHYTCYGLRRTDLGRRPASPVPTGFGPAELRSAYRTPSSTAGAGQTVFVIDAYGYPNAESDLAVYRSHYGMPACTTANGCFKKLNQDGHTAPLPAYDDGWAAESAIDLDMVSAICPLCKITLIEGSDNGDNLFKAVGRANILGAKYVSMSWGGPEDGTEPHYDAAYFGRSGVVYAASAGDGSYQAGVSYPSTSGNVVAVGGTSLVKNSSARGWAETAWGNANVGTGSGCSGDEAKPSWQRFIAPSVCPRRAANDVAAVGDPDTGVAVYQRGSPWGDWSVAGGTSVGAPIIAAVYALAGVPGNADHPASYPYSTTGALNDITRGNNGSCVPALLCTAAVGWDGPTGLGTPRGVAAFRRPAHVVRVNNPGPQTASVGNPVSLRITATDTPAGPGVAFRAAGLPAGLKISASGVITGRPTAVGSSSVTVTATDSTGASGAVTFAFTVGNAGTFTAVAASRLLDTRIGLGAPRRALAAGGSVAVPVQGRGGIPASGVSAVLLNVTVTAPRNPGYVTVYPDGARRPTTSNLNYVKGQTSANLVVVPVGADGRVRLYTSLGAQLIADAAGFYLRGPPVAHGAFAPLNPARLLDTRHGIGARVGVPPSSGTNRLVPSLVLSVLGRGGVPAHHVSAVVLNLTATGGTRDGYVTAYPAGISRPTASTLNFPRGRTVPNLLVVPVGANGKVALYVWGGGRTTNLVADVFGYYTDGAPTVAGTLRALTPSRVLDTRTGNGVGRPGTVSGGHTVSLQVAGRGGVPSTGAKAVLLNVVVVNPSSAGYLTVYARGVAQPHTSNLNYVRGQTVANLVVVPVGAGGQVNLTVTGPGSTGLVADVSGYYLAGR